MLKTGVLHAVVEWSNIVFTASPEVSLVWLLSE
jgi:hypothetical protein